MAPAGWVIGVVAALAAALSALAPAASATRTSLLAYEQLARDMRSPAPPIATWFPPALGAPSDMLIDYQSETSSRYYVRYARVMGLGTAHQRIVSNLVVQDLGRVSLARVGRRERGRFRVRASTVRAHAGLLLLGRRIPEAALDWSENGHVYSIGTGTVGVVGVSQLRRAAEGVEHLLGIVSGEAGEGGTDVRTIEILSERTVTVGLEWEAPCPVAGPELFHDRAGEAVAWSLALNGGAFATGPLTSAASPTSAAPLVWGLSASGSATTSAGQLTFQANAEGPGEHCSVPARTVPQTP